LVRIYTLGGKTNVVILIFLHPVKKNMVDEGSGGTGDIEM